MKQAFLLVLIFVFSTGITPCQSFQPIRNVRLEPADAPKPSNSGDIFPEFWQHISSELKAWMDRTKDLGSVGDFTFSMGRNTDNPRLITIMLFRNGIPAMQSPHIDVPMNRRWKDEQVELKFWIIEALSPKVPAPPDIVVRLVNPPLAKPKKKSAEAFYFGFVMGFESCFYFPFLENDDPVRSWKVGLEFSESTKHNHDRMFVVVKHPDYGEKRLEVSIPENPDAEQGVAAGNKIALDLPTYLILLGAPKSLRKSSITLAAAPPSHRGRAGGGIFFSEQNSRHGGGTIFYKYKF